MQTMMNGAIETKAGTGAEGADALDELMRAFDAFREANDERLDQIERRMGADPVTDEKVDRLSKAMDEHEKRMERLVLRNLRPLQRDGLVTVDGGGRGSRVEVSITAKGRTQMEKLAPAWESAQRTAIEVLGEKRWTTLLADLDKVAAALKN